MAPIYGYVMVYADKDSAIVIMNKMTDMARDMNTYTRLSKDPKHKNRLINILKKSKINGSISDKLYWKLYPDSDEPSVSVSVTGKMSWGHITPVRMVGHLD